MSQPAFSLLHRGVQQAIWKMGWQELHAVQVEAIREIIGGNNHLVITAQTAGGKTEAAFLPIISELASKPQPSIQALYVGPLKALINDQFSRLERLCEALEIPVHRWHGDVSASQKKELRKSPSGILLITPESLESNFVNYGKLVPTIYRHLQFVVIDELHSFLENVRGMHLRSLLTRMRCAAQVSPRIIGLSATIGDPDAARRFICWDTPEKVVHIKDPNSSREIKLGVKAYTRRPTAESERLLEPRLQASEVLELIQRLRAEDLLKQHPFHSNNAPELKPIASSGESPCDEELEDIANDVICRFAQSTNLVFVNAKATIEALADKLNCLVKIKNYHLNPFVVHHGSLSKELREDAETKLKDPAPTTAICSTTLEMGIDIGAVKAVGQIDPPWNVASLVQRLGRSGRKEGESAILRMYIREDSPSYHSELTGLLQPHLIRAVAMIRLMLQKWLEPPKVDQIDLSTLIHQVLSCLKQTGGMQAEKLYQLLIKQGPFRNVDLRVFGALLRGLGTNDVIEQIPTGELILAPKGEKITSAYDFYAAFQTIEEFALYHADRPIGQLPVELIPPAGELILFAGRRWLVISMEPEQKKVYIEPTQKGRPPKFQSGIGEIHPRVATEMRQVLFEDEEPIWLDTDAILLLRAARHVAQVSGLRGLNVLKKEKSIQWFPWCGNRGLLTLAAFASQSGITTKLDSLSLTYQLESLDMYKSHLQGIIEDKQSGAELAKWSQIRSGQKYEDLLSEELRQYSNGVNLLDLTVAKEAARKALEELLR